MLQAGCKRPGCKRPCLAWPLASAFTLLGVFPTHKMKIVMPTGIPIMSCGWTGCADRHGYVSDTGGHGKGGFTTVALPGTKMALKFVNKSKTKLKNFLREVSITNSLSSSPFIIKVFDVVFETEDCYVFAQEYAPAGDLFDIIPPQVFEVGAERGEMVFQVPRV